MRIEFYSCVGGASHLEGLANEWRRAGHEVSFVCAMTEADYRRPRGRLGRLLVRWNMYVVFGYKLLVRGFFPVRGTAVRIVTTNPFFAPALLAFLGARGIPTVNLAYDLYPQALLVSGVLRRGSAAAAFISRITSYGMRRCDCTVFLGEKLRQSAESEGGVSKMSHVLPVGADGAPFRNTPPTLGSSVGVPRILYSGQMGRMHDITTLSLLLSTRSPAGAVEWRFCATGPGARRLKAETSCAPGVSWSGGLSEADWISEMRAASVALVTMAPGSETVVMPSKTYSALVAGQAVLAICPLDSDLAVLVRDHDCGWVVEPGDVEGLRRVVAEISRRDGSVDRKRANAFRVGHERFDVAPVSAAWLSLLSGILGAGERGARS